MGEAFFTLTAYLAAAQQVKILHYCQRNICHSPLKGWLLAPRWHNTKSRVPSSTEQLLCAVLQVSCMAISHPEGVILSGKVDASLTAHQL